MPSLDQPQHLVFCRCPFTTVSSTRTLPFVLTSRRESNTAGTCRRGGAGRADVQRFPGRRSRPPSAKRWAPNPRSGGGAESNTAGTCRRGGAGRAGDVQRFQGRRSRPHRAWRDAARPRSPRQPGARAHVEAGVEHRQAPPARRRRQGRGCAEIPGPAQPAAPREALGTESTKWRRRGVEHRRHLPARRRRQGRGCAEIPGPA